MLHFVKGEEGFNILGTFHHLFLCFLLWKGILAKLRVRGLSSAQTEFNAGVWIVLTNNSSWVFSLSFLFMFVLAFETNTDLRNITRRGLSLEKWVHMCVLACKIWPLFKKLLGKSTHICDEIKKFLTLKNNTFFRNQEKKSTFQKTPIFKKTRNYDFTIFINIHKFIIQRQFVCLNYFKNTLSNIIVYSTITGSLKTIDSWQISRKLKIQCQNMALFVGFHEISGKKNPYHDFAKLALKYPYFHEIWNSHYSISAPKESPPGNITGT